MLRGIDFESAISYICTFKYARHTGFSCKRRVCVHVVSPLRKSESDSTVWDVYAKWAPPAMDPSEETFVNCGYFAFNGDTSDYLFSSYVKKGLKQFAPMRDSVQVEAVNLSQMSTEDATFQLSCLAKQLGAEVCKSSMHAGISDPSAVPQEEMEPSDEENNECPFPRVDLVALRRCARAKTLPQILLETSLRLKLKKHGKVPPKRKGRAVVPLVVYSNAKYFSGCLNYPGPFSLDSDLPPHGTASIYFHEDMEEDDSDKNKHLELQLGEGSDEGFIVDIKDVWMKALNDFEGRTESQNDSD